VIRFDRPSMGLSGPNLKGEYSVVREARVVDAVTRQLGARRFVLVATSSGGAAAAAFAAEHPDRITGLVLNNIAVPPFKLDTSGTSQAFKDALAADQPLGGYHRPEFWRQVLLHNLVDQDKVTAELVTQWTELNNRAPAMPRAAGNPSPGSEFDRTPDDLRRITATTLVIWSADDLDTPLSMGEKVLPLLASRDDSLRRLTRARHYPVRHS
jgi:pimeloyl-ACP methyl ester carboxylesterase